MALQPINFLFVCATLSFGGFSKVHVGSCELWSIPGAENSGSGFNLLCSSPFGNPETVRPD